jgi:anti-sigma factor RsiW
MNGSECAEKLDLLLEYSRGGLNQTASAELEEHLRTCSGCREFEARQREVWSALDVWEAPPVSPGFDARLYSRLEHRPLLERMFGFLRPVNMRMLVPAVAVAGLVVTVVLVSERSNNPAPQPAGVAVTISDEGVENAVDELEILREFNGLMRPDAPGSQL